MREFRLALTYARRELRAGLKGFYIFLACLILGTAAIAGVQSLSMGLLESLRYDGRYILGGDIALRSVYQPATPEQVRFLKKKMGPTSMVMETRAMTRTQDELRTALAELKAVDVFYPLYGEFLTEDEDGKPTGRKIQDLILPSGDGTGDDFGVVVEKSLMSRLGLKIGDTLRIGNAGFILRGVIRREPDRVGGMQFSLAPRALISTVAFDKTGLQEQGNQVYYEDRVLMPYVRTPADMDAAQKAITAAFPDAQWKGRNAFRASPRLETTINRVTQFLTLIGLTTLLIGGVGISNAVRSFLDGKTNNIATLKCLGAPARFVTRLYMTMILILTSVGVAAGVALGAGGGKLAGMLLTSRLELSDRVGLYPSALLTAAAFGFLTGICFSLWPVGRASRVAPNDLFRDLVQPAAAGAGMNTVLQIAIAAQALALLTVLTSYDRHLAVWFIAASLLVVCVFMLYAAGIKAALQRLRLPAKPELRLALSNLYRPGNVTSGIVLSLGMGLTVLVAVALVEDNFSRMLSRELGPDTPSFFFLDVQPDQMTDFTALVATKGRRVEMTPSFRGRIAAVGGKPAEEALVDAREAWVIRSDRGFTWTAKQPPHGEIVAGKWWDENYDGPPLVSIAEDVQRAFDIGVGDEITLNVYGMDVTAKVANVREIDWASFNMNFAITFSPGMISKAPANAMGTAVVPAEAEESLQAEITRRFPNVTVVRIRDALEAAQSMMAAVAQAVRVSAAVTLLAGALVLGGGIAAARRRHVYDAVILKVLGATRARILKTFLLEYGLLGLLAVVIAAAFGTLGAWAVLRQIMDLQWHFSPGALVMAAGVSLGITLLAGFAGTWRALLQKPAPWLRNK